MRIPKRILIFLFIFIHGLFFVHLSYTAHSYYYLIPVALVPLYFLLDFDVVKWSGRELLNHFPYFMFGFFLTIHAQNFIPAVLSAASVAFLFAFAPMLKKKVRDNYSAIVYAGCFAGMADEKWLPNWWFGLLICLIGTMLFLSLKTSLNGVGGKLGSIGFASLVICLLWFWIG